MKSQALLSFAVLVLARTALTFCSSWDGAWWCIFYTTSCHCQEQGKGTLFQGEEVFPSQKKKNKNHGGESPLVLSVIGVFFLLCE